MSSKLISIILSCLAIILSVIAIGVTLSRTELSFDYLGLITGILGLLVTILIGWNIYTGVDFRNEKEQLHKYFEEQKKSVNSVGDDLRLTFFNQLSQNAVSKKCIADVYAEMMGLNKSLPLAFYYLFYTCEAISTAAQAENFEACNVWLREIKHTFVNPELVTLPKSSYRQLIDCLLNVSHKDKLVGLIEVEQLISKVNVVSDPI